MYLCHSFCELGGMPLSDVLDELHDFLVANPNEVVVVINQDYVTPRDFVDAVDAAGLGRFAYRGPTAPGRWPTLRQMIDSGQRVVFLAEEHAGAAVVVAPEIGIAASATATTPPASTPVSNGRRRGAAATPARVAGTCRLISRSRIARPS